MNLGVVGHRPGYWGGWRHNPAWTWVQNIIGRELIRLRPTCIISGMSLGVDQWAVEAALQNDIPYVAVIPWRGQADTWPPEKQRLYGSMLDQAKEVICLNETNEYNPQYIRERNDRLVTLSDEILGIMWSRESGTRTAIDIAVEYRKPIHLFGEDPPSEVVNAINNYRRPRNESLLTPRIRILPSLSIDTLTRDLLLQRTQEVQDQQVVAQLGAPPSVIGFRGPLTTDYQRMQFETLVQLHDRGVVSTQQLLGQLEQLELPELTSIASIDLPSLQAPLTTRFSREQLQWDQVPEASRTNQNMDRNGRRREARLNEAARAKKVAEKTEEEAEAAMKPSIIKRILDL